MVSIGDFELQVLKAVCYAGGRVDGRTAPLSLNLTFPGDVHTALANLDSADYLRREGDFYCLTDQAEEYLEVLGLKV